MSSSDSEDDCYGNVVKTFHSLKNNFQEDRVDSAKLLNNSIDKKKTENTESLNTVQNKELDDTLTDDEEIDKIIALNSTRTTRSRSTRSSKKNETPSCSVKCAQTTRGRGRGRGRKRNQETANNMCSTTSDTCSTSNTCSTTSNTSSVTEPPVNPWTIAARGRNTRRRSARRRSARRGRSGRNSILDAFIQTFSVGNCEEYDDLSNNVQLFSKNNEPADKQVVDDDMFDENEELSVKVIWQSVDIVKFTIRKYQKISQIFEYFSEKTKSSIDKLLFTYNDKILKPDDTPDAINYNIAKFIDGGIVSNTVPLMSTLNKDVNLKPPDGILIKFQYPNSKKAFEVYASENELLSLSMMKCAEHMEVPIKRLKFEFDGDCITGQMTPKGLDMEGGECIDVKIIS